MGSMEVDYFRHFLGSWFFPGPKNKWQENGFTGKNVAGKCPVTTFKRARNRVFWDPVLKKRKLKQFSPVTEFKFWAN